LVFAFGQTFGIGTVNLSSPPPGVTGVVGFVPSPPPGVTGVVGVIPLPPPGVTGVMGSFL